jgi:hypothetical protein
VYVVLDDGEARKVDVLRWGLVPGLEKDIKIGNRMINARAESVPTSGAYRRAFKRRRAILPADGFYEWKKLPGGKRKQPYYLSAATRNRSHWRGCGTSGEARRQGRAVAYGHDYHHGPERDDEADSRQDAGDPST